MILFYDLLWGSAKFFLMFIIICPFLLVFSVTIQLTINHIFKLDCPLYLPLAIYFYILQLHLIFMILLTHKTTYSAWLLFFVYFTEPKRYLMYSPFLFVCWLIIIILFIPFFTKSMEIWNETNFSPEYYDPVLRDGFTRKISLILVVFGVITTIYEIRYHYNIGYLDGFMGIYFYRYIDADAKTVMVLEQTLQVIERMVQENPEKFALVKDMFYEKMYARSTYLFIYDKIYEMNLANANMDRFYAEILEPNIRITEQQLLENAEIANENAAREARLEKARKWWFLTWFGR